MYIKIKEDTPQTSFSLIADFDGDMDALLQTPFKNSLPALPLRNMMLFPGVVGTVTVGRQSSLKLVEQAVKQDSFIAVVAQKDSNVEEPDLDDIYEEGILARVMRTIKLPGGNLAAILQGYGPIKITEIKRRRPFMRVEAEALREVLYDETDPEFKILTESCKETVIKYLSANDGGRSEEAIFAIKNITHPVFLINFICVNMSFSQEERYELFQLHDLKERAYKLLELLTREYEFADMKCRIQARTRAQMDEQQREYFLNQQIKNMQRELGMDENPDVADLVQKSLGTVMPPKVNEIFHRELERLRNISPQMPDYGVQLNYLQTLIGLPWAKQTKDNLNVKNARRVLNRDHYGMEKAKERILEHLASLRYRPTGKSPIICLYGPPGVGKTSLGRSIAEALNRKYVRLALGGMNDEAEIRGHRRTYVGAMPGQIIKSIIKAETRNPLFVLDEIDKVSTTNFSGDPYSALLEVLDPEQNHTFRDNFLDIDFDLSQVFFIATANNLQPIPAPLLDRMEVIEVEGYLTEEKQEIARRHLVVKKQKEYEAEKLKKLKLSKQAIEFLIEKYTRESGVRQLEKQIDKLFRKVAYEMAVSDEETINYTTIKPNDVEHLLGKPIYNHDQYQGNQYPGVVTGLAWTAVGGEILFIETSVSRCKGGKLTLTGNLGDVMKESAVLALEYIKAHADTLGIDYRVFDHWGIHIHVPEGATPKDGPSAGITIATSIASALTQRRVRDHIAMTGEITLRGRVLPVGGIKEKILAAKRAGIRDILISEDNRKDVAEIEDRYVEGLQFHFVTDVNEVLQYSLLDEKVENAIDLTIPTEQAETARPTDEVAVRLMKEK